MLTLLVPICAIFTIATLLPTEIAPPPSPLKEIGHVQSLSVCSALIVHANSAIGDTLDNDQALAIAINRLRTTDLDTSNEIARRNAAGDLSTLAGRLRVGAAGGSAEIKRLRVLAGETTDVARKAELKAFADALGGALARQRKAGTDLDRMLVIIDGRRAVEEVNSQSAIDERAAIAGPVTGSATSLAPAATVIRSQGPSPGNAAVNPMLRSVADDFTERAQSILSDEGVAADHALGATTGC